MKRICYLTVTLSAFWLLLSGHYSLFVLCCGALCVALTLFVVVRMDVVDDESQPLHLTARIVFYWLWLAKEVAVATIDICRRIWSPRLDISPTHFCIDASQKTPLGLMLYANSISVTPGTVCVNIEGNRLEIHALTWSAADDLLSGEMDRRVSQLEV